LGYLKLNGLKIIYFFKPPKFLNKKMPLFFENQQKKWLLGTFLTSKNPVKSGISEGVKNHPYERKIS